MYECKIVILRICLLKGRMMFFYLDYYLGYWDKEIMKVICYELFGIYIYVNLRNKCE